MAGALQAVVCLTPATIIARLDAAIAGYGKTVTLRHLGLDDFGAETVIEEVACPAKIRPFGPQDLEAGEVLPIQVVLSPTSLGSFEIGRDDPIVIEGNNSNVQQIAPLYYGGQLVRVNLLCRG
jgi:hypothetical protein